MGSYIFSETTVYFQSSRTVYYRRPYIFLPRTVYIQFSDGIFYFTDNAYLDRTSLKRKILLRSAVLLRDAVLELRFSVRRLIIKFGPFKYYSICRYTGHWSLTLTVPGRPETTMNHRLWSIANASKAKKSTLPSPLFERAII